MKKLMKKLLILAVVMVMAFTAMPFAEFNFSDVLAIKVSAAKESEPYVWGDYEYKIINSDEVELVNYYGEDTEVTIPSEINGMPVTSIGEYCFTSGDRPTKPDWIKHPNAENNKKIQKLIIPSSVKTICAEAFSFIDSLSEVVLNEGLEFIDEYAFANCPNLTELKLPDSLITFSMLAVTETPVEELVFGSNVEFFTFENFAGKLYVKRVVFNADVITIEGISLVPNETQLEEIVCNGQLFFKGSIEYKGSVKRIVCNGEVSYYDIVGLAGFGMEANFNALDGTVVFTEEKILMPGEHESNGFKYFVDDNSEAIISRYTGGESAVTVPENLGGYPVTQIGTFAFSSLCCSIYDSNDVTDKTIPKDLIVSIKLPETINKINDYAFAGNFSLKEINIPSNVSTIPYECFVDCQSLESVDIPDSVDKIEGGAFYGCGSLESISLPDGITEIQHNTFNGCEALKSIEMPGVKTIGADAFDRCEALANIVFPSTLVSIGKNSFRDTGLKEVILNEGLETIEAGAFDSCNALETVSFPSTLITIGARSFRDTGLKEVVLNEGLKTIGSGAFYNCDKITSVTLPDSLEHIKSNAFYRCHGIKEITIPANLKILGYNAFSRCANLTTIYFNATNCKVSDPQSGETYIPEDWATASPFYATKITNIYFGENITAISGDSETCGTFENCYTLESVSIPASVEEIGTAAFKNCTNLETAVIPDSVTEISEDAFVGCDNLTIYCTETSYAFSYAKANGIQVSTFIIASIPNQIYTGYAIKPDLNVSISDTALVNGVDYSVRYSDNVNAGKATVVVEGIGNYSNFSSKANFTIITKSITAVTVAPIEAQPYTGEAVTPKMTVTDGVKYLVEGKDYTVTYYNNVEEGTATVKLTGKGNYSGFTTASFVISEDAKEPNFFEKLTDVIEDFFARILSFFAWIGI